MVRWITWNVVWFSVAWAPLVPAMGQADAIVDNPLHEIRNAWRSAIVNPGLAGKIRIDGSSTVYPISEAVAAAFKKLFPSVSISLGQSGTGGGFKRFSVGDCDISDASRPIKATEFEACRSNDISFIEIPVAYDGLTVVVNPKCTFIPSLTVDQLRKIFLADGAARTWKDVNGAWPGRPIKVFAPGTDSGTFDYFKEVLAGTAPVSMRADMSTSEDDSILVNGVTGDPNAIGFFGAAYFFQNLDKLRAIPIVNPDSGEPVSPNAQTIEDGSYAPFSRPLFIYLNHQSINQAQVEQFVEYYLAMAGTFAERVGYVPLPEQVYQTAMTNFLDENLGTHYLNGRLEKRSGPLISIYRTENRVE
ncbi:MAG: PstS family phosphate ABC transporter substrate-binding protein [Planctomycetales bacterium]|nr:PstS family phosphate ABC transporter substrate-binding protein [Planctomycetales bacterium]